LRLSHIIGRYRLREQDELKPGIICPAASWLVEGASIDFAAYHKGIARHGFQCDFGRERPMGHWSVDPPLIVGKMVTSHEGHFGFSSKLSPLGGLCTK
jgi:hypothetical protein